MQEKIRELLSLFQKNNFKETMALGNKLAKQFPVDPSVLNILGAVNTSLEDYHKAVLNFRKSVALEPRYFSALNNLGNSLNQLGEYEDAVKVLNKVVKLNPDHVEAHFNLGNALTSLNFHKKATVRFLQAVALSPCLAEAHNNLSTVFQAMGDYLNATEHANKATLIQPDNANVYFNLGNISYQLKNYGAAFQNYQKAIELSPQHAEHYTNLGNVLRELGQHRESINKYKRVLQIEPNSSEAHFNFGTILIDLQRYDQAISHLKRSIYINSNVAEVYQYLGTALCETNKTEESIKNYKRTMLLSPASLNAYIELGRQFHIEGTLRQAKALYRSAIVLTTKPGIANAYFRRLRLDTNELKDTDLRDARLNKTSAPLFKGLRIAHLPVKHDLVEAIYSQPTFNPEEEKISTNHSSAAGIREGGVKHSQGFDLFDRDHTAIQELRNEMTDLVESLLGGPFFITASFFAIYKGDSAARPHHHMLETDRKLNLHSQKHAIVYYVRVGDKNAEEPGFLYFHDPDAHIEPQEGDVILFPADRLHSVSYNGTSDRIIIGMNIYRI